MAGESFYAYVGTRGSGKTHEGSKRIIEQAWLGRDIVVVQPEFRVDRLVDFLNDRDAMLSLGEGHPKGPVAYLAEKGIDLDEEREFDLDHVSKYVQVCDYDVLEMQSGFWPDEDEMRVVRDRDGNLVFGPKWRADGWRRAIVRAGAFVVVDEAWRLMDDATRIPPSAKKMFRMMRHWRGPIDWRDPLQVARYLSDENPWHPGLAGPIDDGGDGTQLVSMNLLVLTQDYQALDAKLRRQVNQITDLFTYPNGHISKFLARLNPAWDVEGKYSATTFASHLLPARGTLSHRTKRDSFEVLPHNPRVHALTEKAGGASVEARIDNRSTMASSVEAKGLRGQWIFVGLMLTVCIGYLLWWWLFSSSDVAVKKPVASPTPVASSSAPSSAADASQASPKASPGVSLPKFAKSSSDAPVARVVGTIGPVVMVVGPDGLTRYGAASSYQTTPEMGLVGSIDGVTVSRWSAPVGDVADGGGRSSSAGRSVFKPGLPERDIIPDSAKPADP